jgi:hypothetical protein
MDGFIVKALLQGVSPPQRRNKLKSVFFGDMCVEENTARPGNV